MYDLHNLGWHSFQQLCLTVASEVLGQTVESFLDSNDGGRDGAFTGQWHTGGGEDLSGRFVIQCKFTSRIGHRLRPSDLADEAPKIAKLVERGLCDAYVLMTNAGLSGRNGGEITDLLRSAGAKHVVLLDGGWLSRQIRENQRLRMLVPRVYGLGDLSQILDERCYDQARAILDSLRDDLAKVVVTDAYRHAAAALDRHGFVLLIGEPAAGKTTIASMLAVAALDQWQASMLKLDVPAKVVERWNPREPSQFFWIDDAFGVTQYEAPLIHAWNHILPQICTMLRRGARIVMTSRDYIYNRARRDLKEGAFPLLKESQVVIDVHDLSVDEKRQILYNHLKLGRQPTTFRAQAKPHLEAVATHPRFIPEIARRLADPVFTDGLRCDAHNLTQFVEKRERFLRETLHCLDAHSKAALALIYMRNDRLESPVTLQESEEQAVGRLGSDFGGCVTALEALNGSLVVHSLASGDAFWCFKHPTIGDAYAAILAQSPELLGIFIHGTVADKLMRQVTCGDVGMENAIIIPRALFPVVLFKLRQFRSDKTYRSANLSAWDAESKLQGFLARRCSNEFLLLYLNERPDLLERVSEPGLFLSAVAEVDLAVRLHEFGLLPEDNRKRFVTTVSEYAIRGEDLFALVDDRIRSVFDSREFEQLLRDLRTRLLPRLGSVRLEWQSDCPSRETPDAHMQPLLESFETLRSRFGDDAHVTSIVDRETRLANEWIAENMPPEPDRTPRTLGSIETPEKPPGDRSIFDDIDA